jgi:hypothetical protein
MHRGVKAIILVLLFPGGLIGCVPPAGMGWPVPLAQTWMFGIETMRGDPEPQLPFTNRFIADLSAMPRVQIVYVGSERNDFLFNAWKGNKVLVSPWLHGEGNCMNLAYTVFQSGEQQGLLGIVVPPLPAGTEPDSACVDRAATQFYQALVVQRM